MCGRKKGDGRSQREGQFEMRWTKRHKERAGQKDLSFQKSEGVNRNES